MLRDNIYMKAFLMRLGYEAPFVNILSDFWKLDIAPEDIPIIFYLQVIGYA